MKICVSAVSGSLDAQIDPRFGRCQYFVIVDSDTMEFEAIPNASQFTRSGAGIQAAQNVTNKGVNIVLTGNIGPNAFKVLSEVGITVVAGVSGLVRDAVKSFNDGKFQQIDGPTVGGHSAQR